MQKRKRPQDICGLKFVYKEKKKMKKTIKLKKNYEFQRVLQKGKYFSGTWIEGFFIKSNHAKNYLGIAISSKLCNAVKRNRMKRIFQEVYREQEKNIKTGNTFVFLWKKKVAVEECTYDHVKQDMEEIFKKLGIIIHEENDG